MLFRELGTGKAWCVTGEGLARRRDGEEAGVVVVVELQGDRNYRTGRSCIELARTYQ